MSGRERASSLRSVAAHPAAAHTNLQQYTGLLTKLTMGQAVGRPIHIRGPQRVAEQLDGAASVSSKSSIQQRRLWRRQTDPAQQDAAFGQAARRESTAKSSSIPGQRLPPSMQPKVSRISRRADATALAGKSA
jgi:hypothetical protein